MSKALRWRVSYRDRDGRKRRVVIVSHPGPVRVVAMDCFRKPEWWDNPTLHGAGGMYGRTGVGHLCTNSDSLTMTDGMEMGVVELVVRKRGGR